MKYEPINAKLQYRFQLSIHFLCSIWRIHISHYHTKCKQSENVNSPNLTRNIEYISRSPEHRADSRNRTNNFGLFHYFHYAAINRKITCKQTQFTDVTQAHAYKHFVMHVHL